MVADCPVIVFGAFDRHNFGDLLFAHIAAELLQPRPVVFAGLAERDLTPWGGHQVRAIANLAREWGERPAHVVHCGGEILTCTTYEAAVMLLDPEAARRAIAHYDRDPVRRVAWAQAQLGLQQGIAYMLPRQLFRQPGQFVYAGVGGVGLAHLPASLQEEVLANLRAADHVSVRDRHSLTFLEGHGLRAGLAPDPAELTAELFAPVIAMHQSAGEPRAVSERFPQGYVAVQFSADFGDDATLRPLAAQLDQIAEATGLGIVLFRAGAAPWHDDLDAYRRLAGFMRSKERLIFGSLHLWDICALLAGAGAYCGSSLHGRIVAASFGVAGVNLVRDGAGISKQAAYAATWAANPAAIVTTVEHAAECVKAALSVDPDRRRLDSARQAALARQAGQAWLARLN